MAKKASKPKKTTTTGTAAILGDSGKKAAATADTQSSYSTINNKDPFGKSEVVKGKDGSVTITTTPNKHEQDLIEKGRGLSKSATTGASGVLGGWGDQFGNGKFDSTAGFGGLKPGDYSFMGKQDPITDSSQFGTTPTLDWQGLTSGLGTGKSSSDIIGAAGKVGGLDFSGDKWGGSTPSSILGDARKYSNDQYSRFQQMMQPEFARQGQALTESMLNRGIATGSNPFTNSVQKLSEQQGRTMLDAANQADQMGMDFATSSAKLGNDALASQGHLILGGNAGNAEAARLGLSGDEQDFSQGLGLAQGIAGIQDTAFGQSSDSQGMQLTAQGQQWAQGQDKMQAQYKGTKAGFDESLASGGFIKDKNALDYTMPLDAAHTLQGIASAPRPGVLPGSATYQPPDFGGAALGYSGQQVSKDIAAINAKNRGAGDPNYYDAAPLSPTEQAQADAAARGDPAPSGSGGSGAPVPRSMGYYQPRRPRTGAGGIL